MGFVSIDIQCASGLFRTPKSEPGISEVLSSPCCDPHGWIFQWGAGLNTLKVFKCGQLFQCLHGNETLEKPWPSARPIGAESRAVCWQSRREGVSSLDFPTHPLSLGLGEHIGNPR